MELNYLKDKFFNDLYDNVKDSVDPELMDCANFSTYHVLCHKVGTSIRFDKVFNHDEFSIINAYVKRHPDYSFFIVKITCRVDLIGCSKLLDLFK